MELFDKLLKEGEQKLEETVKKGLADGEAKGVLELLQKLGPIPEDLKAKITSEVNGENAAKWLKMAKESKTIEAFIEQIKADK